MSCFLTEREIDILKFGLQSRIDEMAKLRDDCQQSYDTYVALPDDERAKYDAPKQTIEHGDGTFTIDCTPHPIAYKTMARAFGEQADETQKLLDKMSDAHTVSVEDR